MSKAFRCDLCGDCIDNEDDARQEREVARETSTIAGTSAELYIELGVDVAHVCNACFAIALQQAKAWIVNNV